MKRFRIFSFIFALLFVAFACTGALAESDPANGDREALIRETAKKTVEEEGKRQFAGLSFGVGVSLTVDIGSNDRVEEAAIVNGVVRVENENNADARIMLESHYFFTPDKVLGIWENPDEKIGIGPFIALQPGTDEIIEAIALGAMFGLKRENFSSWNLGIGFVVDPNVQILGDGFEPNQPPPAGETVIRYKETDQWGVVIISSFSF